MHSGPAGGEQELLSYLGQGREIGCDRAGVSGMGVSGLGNTIKKMRFMISYPGTKHRLGLGEMRRERGAEDVTISRQDSIAESVEICNALDSLPAAFGLMGISIFAMTAVTAELPKIVQKMKNTFEDDTKTG